MKITDALLGEHGVFYALFDHLEGVLSSVDTLAQAQGLSALLAAGLEPHAHLENEVLFAALEPHLGAEAGPLAVLRYEHEEIEASLGRVQEVADGSDAKELVRAAINVARQHFAKEEQVLFPLAERVLGPERLSALGARWSERRGVWVQ